VTLYHLEAKTFQISLGLYLRRKNLKAYQFNYVPDLKLFLFFQIHSPFFAVEMKLFLMAQSHLQNFFFSIIAKSKFLVFVKLIII
jgi:hypothetical protein